jgi:hypothetical protein
VPVNRQQNDWTQRQLFNPNTLVLRSTDGNQVTVNAATGRPGDEVVTLPVPGTIVGFMQASSSLLQQLTTTETPVDFNTTGDSNNITRAGPNFTVLADGKFSLFIWLRILQQQNNSVTRVWAIKNGVAIPFFGATAEPTAAGDAISISTQGFINLAAGDVIAFRALTSAANGAQLEPLTAAAPAPAIASVMMNMVGYLR